MTYTKEERAEDMQQEAREDIQEKANEVSDGQMETWIIDNHSDLVNEFIEENPEHFQEYCKSRWNEINE